MNPSNKRIKRLWKTLRKTVKCERCGATQEIQFAHIRATKLTGRGRGRKERYYDIKKHPLSYLPLCKKCHGVFDSAKTN